MNHLHYGDNLAVLRASIGDETVDLVYLDPPFNSNATYKRPFQIADRSAVRDPCDAAAGAERV